MNGIKCSICFSAYDDSSLRPRSLSCGHTFCQECLKNTLQNELITCPQCRKTHHIISALDIPVNYALEEILKSFDSCSIEVSKGATVDNKKESGLAKGGDDESQLSHVQQENSVGAKKETLKASSGTCHEHPNMECIFHCSTHMCWVCELCIKEDENHPEKECEIIPFKEEIEQRKLKHIESLKDEEDSCDETLTQIQKHILHLTSEKEHHISLINSLQDLVSIHQVEEENLNLEINSFVNNIEKGEKVKQKLLDDRESILNALTLNDSNSARNLVRKKMAEAKSWINTSQKEILEDKIKIADSTYKESTEKSLDHWRDCEQSRALTKKTVLNSLKNDKSAGIKCGREYEVEALFYTCLQCRTAENIILCGSCFVNSAHVKHMHEIRSIGTGFCDCGDSEAWKSNPTCVKHLKTEPLPQPYDVEDYASSKCEEVFFDGEKCFSCIDCCKNPDGFDVILCGSCFVNSSHRNHAYEVYNCKADGGFCDCGKKESWKKDHSCFIHADIDSD